MIRLLFLRQFGPFFSGGFALSFREAMMPFKSTGVRFFFPFPRVIIYLYIYT